MTEDHLNPGSPAAVANGCKCPVLDNGRGQGAWGSSGKDAIFWITASCPLHGSSEPTPQQPDKGEGEG